MVRTFYQEDVWAIIGSVDSASTHLLEQISAKIRIPVMSPVSTDKSANLANVPWLFSMQPGDHNLAEQLAAELGNRIRANEESFVLVSGMDHDSRLFAREFRMQISEKKLVPEFIFEYDPDIPLPWDRIRKGTATFVVIASPPESASLVKTIRETNPEARILGGPFMGRNSFLRAFRGDCGENRIHITRTCQSRLRFLKAIQRANRPESGLCRGRHVRFPDPRAPGHAGFRAEPGPADAGNPQNVSLAGGEWVN